MSSAIPRRVTAALSRFFARNGYVRRQNLQRLSREGYLRYKKGDEVRLTAESPRELARIRQLLQQAGFKPGRPFAKGHKYRQPVYGRGAVERFLSLVAKHENAEHLSSPRGQ